MVRKISFPIGELHSASLVHCGSPTNIKYPITNGTQSATTSARANLLTSCFKLFSSQTNKGSSFNQRMIQFNHWIYLEFVWWKWDMDDHLIHNITYWDIPIMNYNAHFFKLIYTVRANDYLLDTTVKMC